MLRPLSSDVRVTDASSRLSQSTVSEALARWIAGLRWEDLPVEVTRMAKRVVLDTLGCALQGRTTPEAARLRQVREDLGSTGPCTVWGTPSGAAPQLAALLNGTHAHLRELDDVGCGGHAGASQIPAALAAAELGGADGRDVLLGVVAGHEVASRLTDALSDDTLTLRGWHSTGIYGSLGAAAAAARVLSLDSEATADALGLAGSFTGGIWACMADGAMSKRLHPGKAAETGLTAAMLARRGVGGPREVLEAAWGGLFETTVPGESDSLASLHNLGDGFRILRKGFNPYPVCWGINSALDAMLALRAERRLDDGNVRRVRVTLSEMSRRMVGGTRIRSVLDAQMSVSWALAWVLLRGRLTLEEFGEHALRDPAAREVMGRIELHVDPVAHGECQTVEVETVDGGRYRARVETPRGHWDHPLTGQELREKFVSLAAPSLGATGAADVEALVERLDAPDSLPALLCLLRS